MQSQTHMLTLLKETNNKNPKFRIQKCWNIKI